MRPRRRIWTSDSGALVMSGNAVPADLRRAYERNAPDFRDRLRAALEARREVRGGHADWGAFCEEAGEFGLAFSEYQLALRDGDRDAHVLARLAELSEERGDLDRAAGYARRLVASGLGGDEALLLLVRLLAAGEQLEDARRAIEEARTRGASPVLVEQLERELGKAAPAEADETAVETAAPWAPTDADVVRFAHLFGGREDVYARQWWGEHGEGGYSPVREPFTPKVARNHLLGGITVGIYPVRLDDTVTFCAFDIDLTKRAIARARGSVQEARRLKALIAETGRGLIRALEQYGLEPLVEESGYKGRHLWLFFERPEPARVVHQFGTLLLKAFRLPGSDVHVEFFPKQASAGAGLGNLIKLPLGIHRRTGRRSRLLGRSGEPESDPFGALRRQPKVSKERLYAALAQLKAAVPAAGARAQQVEASPDGASVPGAQAEIPAPAPPAPPPAWTAGDFETHPEMAHLLRQCPVLGALKEKVDRHRRLTHDEQVVLVHALGHSAAGVLAVNYLLDACVDAPPSVRLQTPLSGNPISCPRIRKRIPAVTASVDCNCVFPFAPNHYPTPRLHLATLETAPPAAAPRPVEVRWDPAERARVLGVLWVRRERLLAEIAQLERELVEYMERERVASIDTGDGTLHLVLEEGAPPALAWRRHEPGGADPPEPEPSAVGDSRESRQGAQGAAEDVATSSPQ